MSDVDPKTEPASVRIEIYAASDGGDELRVRDVTHLRDLIRLAADLDERERRLAEREQGVAGRTPGAPAPSAAPAPTPTEPDPPDLGAEIEQRRAWQQRLAEAEGRLRERVRELDARENEIEARAAVVEADLELREDELERRERAVEELERRLESREAELAAYVARVQGGLGRAVA
jgi:DNA repair exonuclease SbcCD ATPase subunit